MNEYCPNCGEEEEWYPEAVPTGRMLDGDVPELELHPTAGHCLECDHFEAAFQ